MRRGISAQAAGEIALALPGVTRGTYYGFPAYLAGKRFLARVRTEDGVLVVHIGSFTDRDLLISDEPQTFFTTDHYRNYPMVLVRLEHVRRATLRGILTDALSRLSRAPAKRRLAVTRDTEHQRNEP